MGVTSASLIVAMLTSNRACNVEFILCAPKNIPWVLWMVLGGEPRLTSPNAKPLPSLSLRRVFLIAYGWKGLGAGTGFEPVTFRL